MFIISFVVCVYIFIFFFKQKTAYEMRISDWSSDVCSSDLLSLCHPVFYLELLRIGGGLNRVRNLVAVIVLDPSRREWRVCVYSQHIAVLCETNLPEPGIINGTANFISNCFTQMLNGSIFSGGRFSFGTRNRSQIFR